MLTPGTVVQNRYQVIRLLGQGGFGAVYQARDMRLGQIVALKENTGGDPRQFQQEAFILANLRHPNLPRVNDHFVEPNGAQYLVMDFVEGEDLESVLQRQGALPEAQVLTWFDQILDAVAYLHSHNIIHRDIKPANIKITPAGQAVLVDFGIAKVFQPGQFTVSGAKAASPGFSAPEQYRGGTDQQSDIYSLGATLYALLTGSAPPDAQALERRTAILVPPRTVNPALSTNAEQAVLQAMVIQPSQRFQSTDAMRCALKSANLAPTLPAAQPPPPRIPPTQPVAASVNPRVETILGIVAIIAIACVVLAVVGYLVVQGQLNTVAQALASPTPTRGLVLPTIPPPPTLPLKPTDTPLPPPTPVVTTTIPLTPTLVPTKTATPRIPTLTAKPEPKGQIVFETQLEGKSQISLVNVDGTSPRSLTQLDSEFTDGDPSWSPDGRLILFASKRQSDHRRIWVMNADGTNQRLLNYKDRAGVSDLRWSPDGRYILFTSDPEDYKQIFVMNADGTNQRTLHSLTSSPYCGLS